MMMMMTNDGMFADADGCQKTFTAGDRVEIWKASSLPGFYDSAEKHVIW